MSITPLPNPPQTTDPATFDVKADAWVAALGTFTTEANSTAAAMNLNATNGNSTTSTLIGAGSKTITADLNKSWQIGMFITVASTASPANAMVGYVTAYTAGTGSLTFFVTSTRGTGTLASWTISQGSMYTEGVFDLTGYAGADITLQPGQTAIYDVTASTALLLRIATANNQSYAISFAGNAVAGVAAQGTVSSLQPNNAAAPSNVVVGYIYTANNTPTGSSTNTNPSFLFDAGFQPIEFNAVVNLRTTGKTFDSTFLSAQTTPSTTNKGNVGGYWNDTTTVVTSLGTLISNAMTGRVRVTRLY